MQIDDKCVVVRIDISYPNVDKEVYDAARRCWMPGPGGIEKARQADYVLAVHDGKVAGVFKPTEWKITEEKECDAEIERCRALNTKEVFKKCKNRRIRFCGVEADKSIADKYLGNMVPLEFTKGYPFQHTF